mgnify:CR=1 FL=1
MHSLWKGNLSYAVGQKTTKKQKKVNYKELYFQFQAAPASFTLADLFFSELSVTFD